MCMARTHDRRVQSVWMSSCSWSGVMAFPRSPASVWRAMTSIRVSLAPKPLSRRLVSLSPLCQRGMEGLSGAWPLRLLVRPPWAASQCGLRPEGQVGLGPSSTTERPGCSVPLTSLRGQARPEPSVNHVTAQGVVHSVDRGHRFGNECGHLLWQNIQERWFKTSAPLRVPPGDPAPSSQGHWSRDLLPVSPSGCLSLSSLLRLSPCSLRDKQVPSES